MLKPKKFSLFGTALIALTLLLAISACTGSTSATQVELTLARESALPEFIRSAPDNVKEAYRFAIANPDALRLYPCYCGCGAMGHQNNLDCYIKEIRPDGSIEFENHAFG